MEWPDYSWLFSRFLHYDEIRVVASVACLLATIGFVAGGIGMLLELVWWSTALIISAAFSGTLFFVFWDGDTARLTNQGAVDFLINIVILIVLLRQ